MTDQIGLFETMYSCRAMRRLDPDPVPEELLLRLVDAANQAPSGRNFQRWRWIIVLDDQKKHRVAELNRRASEDAAREQAEHGDPLLHEMLGLPNDAAAQAIIPVGFPIGNFGPVTRRPVHEITTFDRWDGPHPAALDDP